MPERNLSAAATLRSSLAKLGVQATVWSHIWTVHLPQPIWNFFVNTRIVVMAREHIYCFFCVLGIFARRDRLRVFFFGTPLPMRAGVGGDGSTGKILLKGKRNSLGILKPCVRIKFHAAPIPASLGYSLPLFMPWCRRPPSFLQGGPPPQHGIPVERASVVGGFRPGPEAGHHQLGLAQLPPRGR